MKADFHFHSVYSDGAETPKELVRNYQKLGFKILALTDHNTIAGFEELKKEAEQKNIKAILGVELSAQYQGIHLHLMAYNFDQKKMMPLLQKIQRRRVSETKQKIAKLQKLGFDISWQALIEFFPYTRYWGNKHLLNFLKKDEKNRALLQKFSPRLDLWELIEKLFGRGAPAFVEEEYLDVFEVLEKAKKANALVSIAHPAMQLRYDQDYIIKELAQRGLDAIEAVSLQHNWDNIVHYQMLAKKLKLKITAGTDFHEKVDFIEWASDPRSIWDLPESFDISWIK